MLVFKRSSREGNRPSL